MAKMSKQQLLDWFTERKIEVKKEDRDNYQYLLQMYKEQMQKAKIESKAPNAVPVGPQISEEERQAKEDSETKRIHTSKGWSQDVIKVARKAGFSFEQIDAFPSELQLKAKVVQVSPKLQKEFITRGEAALKPKETKVVQASESFAISIMGGFGPPSQNAAKEQREIENNLRKIPMKRAKKLYIERSLIPDDMGRMTSIVSVEYEKEEEVKEN